MTGINGTMRIVRELVGTEGTRVFEKNEFLSKVKEINEGVAKTIEESVSGVTNPSFEVTGKAAANYNIAAFRIKDGNKVIGSGSTSISFSDVTKQPEIKSRMSLPNGVQSRGVSEDEEFIEVANKNGKEIVKKYSMKDGELLSQSPVDTTVVRTEAGPLKNSICSYNEDGLPIVYRFKNKDNISISKTLSDGSSLYMYDRPNSIKIEHCDKGELKARVKLIVNKNDNGTQKMKITIDDREIYVENGIITEASKRFQDYVGKPLDNEFIKIYELNDILEAYKKYPEEIKESKKLFKEHLNK